MTTTGGNNGNVPVWTTSPDIEASGSSNPATIGGNLLITGPNPWIDVTSAAYMGGAKCDGATDDTLAIQNAINAAPVGGSIYIPNTGKLCNINGVQATMSNISRKATCSFAFTTGYLMCSLGLLSVVARSQTNPVPLINQPPVPTIAAPSSPNFTLTVHGTSFVSGSTVQWNGTALPTQFGSASRLTATVPAPDVVSAGTASVRVSSPAPGGGVSNSQLFSITTSRPNIALGALQGDPLGYSPQSLSLADFNGDGKPDLAVVNYDGGVGNTGSVMLGNGDGTFQAPLTFGTGNGPYSIAVADFNQDGKVDLAVTNETDNTVSVLLGNGDGTFQAHVDYVAGTGPKAVTAADFNADGKLDLAVSNYFDSTVSTLLGNGDGTFQPQLTSSLGNGPISLVAGDFNGDGKLDLAVAAYGVDILTGKGDGTFQWSSTVGAGGASALATADLNGDAKLDLVFTNGSASVALGKGDGTFKTPVAYPTDNGPTSLAVADFNGDGKLDVVTFNQGLSVPTLSTLLGNGDGTFQNHVDQPAGAASSAGVGDFSLDGLIDLAAVYGASVTLFVGTTAELSPYIVDFGTVPVGATSPPQTVTLTNGGSASLMVSSIEAVGNFGETNNCGTSLAAGASCTINVTFTPTFEGDDSGSVLVTDSAQGSPQSVALSGIGQAPAVSLSPTSLVFGDQKVGTKSQIQTVTLTNTGNASLTITGITASGEFAERNNCGPSLGAGASCTISVLFGPTVQGTKTGALTVTDNAAGSPETVSVAGTGIVFELSPSFLNFGNVVIGNSVSQNIMLTNSSSKAQTVNGIGLGGNHAGEFSQTNNCGSSLGANASCTITVTFAPTKLGSSVATLQVSGGGANQVVPISGAGIN